MKQIALLFVPTEELFQEGIRTVQRGAIPGDLLPSVGDKVSFGDVMQVFTVLQRHFNLPSVDAETVEVYIRIGR